MSGHRWSEIERIFDVARAMAAVERDRYLDEACAGDPALRAEIESLLESHDATGFLLDGPAVEGLSVGDLDPTGAFEAGPEASHTVGPYRLQRKLGEGGMGEVWLADQETPIRRRVALKVIKRGLESKEVIARFEAERQALALMDHPNIATVFDAGTTRGGRPYFAMEYVDGIPITSYCHTRSLTTRERLQLFVQVCRGIQHAHQKAVIHRDLKPSNVLVAEREGIPSPKIIDFGVAKALLQPLTEATLLTGLGQFIGTPAYMSPEQAEMSPEGVDTRTDVYSLGVILYELLAGVTPLDPVELRRSGFDEIRRKIREEEPRRPSTQVLHDRGARPWPEATALIQRLRGDLDWIVMKSLEKDRDRRYGTAAELAADIERHLHDLPVLARPPSRGYRTVKFIRRHKVGVTTAATVFALLVAFAVSTALQARRIAEQRDVARQAEARATAINDFLVNDMLAAASPEEAEGRELTVAQVLDAASQRIEKSFVGRPTIEVPLRVTLGRIYVSLGRFDEAEHHYVAAESLARREIGPRDPRTLAAVRGLGFLNSARGRFDRAELLYREALEGQEQVLGPRHPETLETLNQLGIMLTRARRYEDGAAIGRKALELCREVFGDEDRRTVESLLYYAIALVMTRSPDADRFIREAGDRCRAVLGPRDPLNTEALNGLAIHLNREGRIDEAEAVLRDCARLSADVYGEGSPQTLTVRANLARLIREKGERPWEAEPLYRGLLAEWRKLSADEGAISTANQLGELLVTLGRADEAHALLTETLREGEQQFGLEHTQVANTLADLGWAERVQGRFPEAEGHYRRALEIRRKLLGEEHEYTLRVAAQLGWVMAEQGRHVEGERLARAAVESGEKALPANHLQIPTLLEYLGRILLASGRAGEGETYVRRALEIRKAGRAPVAAIAESEILLAECLLREGNLAEAEGLLSHAWPVIARTRGASYPLRQDAHRDVRELYKRMRTPEKAAALLAAPTLEELAARG
jgi:serine/threonine protein kinase/tetratricopeptide (TPR) repeat protein